MSANFERRVFVKVNEIVLSKLDWNYYSLSLSSEVNGHSKRLRYFLFLQFFELRDLYISMR